MVYIPVGVENVREETYDWRVNSISNVNFRLSMRCVPCNENQQILAGELKFALFLSFIGVVKRPFSFK